MTSAPTSAPPARSPRRAWVRSLCALTLLAGIVWHRAAERVPSPAAVGAALQGETGGEAVRPRRFRVGTFNIHGGRGADGQLDLNRIARLLDGCQLVGLNEVHGAWLSRGPDQAELLARDLQSAWLFAPTERRYWHYDFGNGLLSRWGTSSWQRLPLPKESAKSYRNVLWASFPWDGATLHVLITHLDRSDALARTAQFALVARLFRSLPQPIVLMGDLNADADDPLLQELLATPDVCDPLAETRSTPPPRRIDWILARGLVPCDADVVDSGASDHPFYWAEFEWPQRGEWAERQVRRPTTR